MDNNCRKTVAEEEMEEEYLGYEEEHEIEEEEVWTDEKTDELNMVYRKHVNGHWYMKIEEDSEGRFKTYKNLVNPKDLKMRRLDGDEKDIEDLEKNALMFVGSLIGFVRVDNDNSLNVNIDVENFGSFQELYWSIHDFIESGSGKDAFNVYYLFICRVMKIKKYKDIKSIIEMLSNYESNAANLVMSHRDHYVHSVYVFLIGLAIYNSSSAVQTAYREYYMEYHKDETDDPQDITLKEHFIKYWGITSLFHDIGYVYEIPFEQIKSYGSQIDGSLNKIFLVYKNVDFWDDIRNRPVSLLKDDLKILCDFDKTKHLSYSLDEIFTYNIKRRLIGNKERKVDWNHVYEVLNFKATDPELASSKNGHPISITDEIYMDHAYFSAKILFDILLKHIPLSEGLCDKRTLYDYMDVLTAVLMHNSLFKFVIKSGHPLELEEHPLAFILMLCDELQIWNRTSFGVTSKGEMHAMGIDMSIADDTIRCAYRYDKDFESKEKKKKSLIKMFPDKDSIFLNDIKEIVSVNVEGSGLKVKLDVDLPKFDEDERYRAEGLSDGNLLCVYELANNLWKQTKEYWKKDDVWEKSQDDFFDAKDFGDLDVHIQNSYINRAKELDTYLFRCGYFYTDRKLGLRRMGDNETFSQDEEKSIIRYEIDRLSEELKRYGQVQYTENDDKIRKYAIIPPIKSANEIKNAINKCTGLSIYRFKQ